MVKMMHSLHHAADAAKRFTSLLKPSNSSINAPAQLARRAQHSFVASASPAVVRSGHLSGRSSSTYPTSSSRMMTRNSAASVAAARLSLINRHLEDKNTTTFPPLNTPYSTERYISPTDDSLPYTPLIRSPPRPTARRSFSSTSTNSSKMSKQAEHPALLIPGPIEISDEVSSAMGTFAQSHVGQPFVNVFGEALALLRKLFQTTNPNSQPFVLAGSGTLGWDLVAANLIEPGEDVLVLHTGYFANSFADCFETYGAKPTQLKAAIGSRPQLPEIEKALKEKKYKMITVTHVDTSTGVLSQVEPLAKLIKEVSPETLLVVDGVCSIGAENLEFDAWGVDVALTASQKAIGCPPGLSITMVSEKAMNVFKSRKSPPGSYYASFKNWTPIMQNYEAKKPSYFATPPTQLIHALHAALTQLLAIPISQRFEQHKKISAKVKAAVSELGLKQLASNPEDQASAMTAMYLPEGLTPPEILPSLMKKGVVFAGGLHKEIATKYIRFGHMGVSVMDEGRGEIDKAIAALKESLADIQKAKGQ